MSKKRGLSLEEKRDKMLEVFYDSQSFYQLKDLEKIGPKKGVVSQSVKDVIQSLVDDDLVFKDKIGTSLRLVRAKLEGELATLKGRQSELKAKCESSKEGRKNSDEREAALSEMSGYEQKHKVLQEEINKYADNDPATYDSMRKATKVAHDAANRWTGLRRSRRIQEYVEFLEKEASENLSDNIFALQKWCSLKFPEAREKLEELYKEVGITEDFDYVE